MNVVTFEGVVDHGQIRLNTDAHLPEGARVYVIVPGMRIEQIARVFSPRLAHAEQAADFEMEIIEESSDAGV
jgi:NhaP-type Na+/H+ and K+/H+ antiporter